MSGEQNVFNATAALATLELMSVESRWIQSSLAEFRGVERRQQILYQDDQWILINDFAHHPTAIGMTLKGLKAAFPERELWALFEPRSNTSRRSAYQDLLPDGQSESFPQSPLMLHKD